MRHQQILDALAARELVSAVNDDVAIGVGRVGGGGGGSDGGEGHERVVGPILARWRCLLDADDVPRLQKDKAWVALATVLHEHGVADEDITAQALRASDDLDRESVLSEAFRRQSDAIAALLRSAPAPPGGRLARPEPVTALRAGDVVSIQLDQRFYAACVLGRDGEAGDVRPVIELYRSRFERLPTAYDLDGRALVGENGRGRFGVHGLTYLPDPANQVVLIASIDVGLPLGGPAAPGQGEWIATDILQMQEHIRKVFATDP